MPGDACRYRYYTISWSNTADTYQVMCGGEVLSMV